MRSKRVHATFILMFSCTVLSQTQSSQSYSQSNTLTTYKLEVLEFATLETKRITYVSLEATIENIDRRQYPVTGRLAARNINKNDGNKMHTEKLEITNALNKHSSSARIVRRRLNSYFPVCQLSYLQSTAHCYFCAHC